MASTLACVSLDPFEEPPCHLSSDLPLLAIPHANGSGTEYRIFICLKIVDFPLSPVPRTSSFTTEFSSRWSFSSDWVSAFDSLLSRFLPISVSGISLEKLHPMASVASESSTKKVLKRRRLCLQ